MIRTCPQTRNIYIHCLQSTPREDLPINFKVQQGKFGVMFRGCISDRGVGPLIPIQDEFATPSGTLDSEHYLKIIEQALVPYIDRLGIQNPIFMQDNVSIHKTRRVTAFLEENSMTVLKWPPNSPDLNPIENAWNLLKRKLAEKGTFPTTKSELVARALAAWSTITPQICFNLCHSLEHRMVAVEKSKGKPINY